jgi:1-deoxy-D-xylulose-5-phosphate reductoisomerase
VVALAAGSNETLLADQVREFKPTIASLDLRAPDLACADVECLHGRDGLMACATHPDADLVVVATSGVASIEAVLAAARLGRTIALANKEALVCAADLCCPLSGRAVPNCAR